MCFSIVPYVPNVVNMKSKIAYILPALIISFNGYSQQVTNVKARQEDKKIVISYDLAGGDAGQTYTVGLLVSEDGGYSWKGPAQAVSGDVGSGIKSGYSTQLVWDVLAEPGRDRLQGDRVAFKVRAEYVKPVSEIEPEMVYIQGGTFKMGSNENDDEKPVHSVTVRSFYMGKYEVTVAQFRQFINETGYQTDADKDGGSYMWTGSNWESRSGVNWKCDAEGNQRPQSEYNHPVIHVSWNDAMEYCRWLSRKTGKSYRLPTEVEWEYAAGNGSRHTKYSWGNGDPYGKSGGNVADESAKRNFSSWTIWNGYDDGFVFTAPVGSFNPNDFGLYDMTGNVWEWCSDWYGSDYYKSSPSSNPKGPSSGSSRVVRGGSWGNSPAYQRVAGREDSDPSGRDGHLGFRLARTE
jgi:formylglycine-generating enzyme required for sulfatase activity